MLLVCLLAFSAVSFSQQFQPNESKPTVAPSPLIIVDGKIMPSTFKSKTDSTKFVNTLDTIDPKDIAEMRVIKQLDAVSAYGEKGRNGVVIITTKAYLQKSKKQ